MIEDKLEHDERLRLECLAQAMSHNMRKPPTSAEVVIEDAKRFEKYVKGE